MLAHVEAVLAEEVSLAEGCGRVLAADICSDRPSPAMDYSAMDGFAIRTTDLARGVPTDAANPPVFEVVGEVRIGREPPVLPPTGWRTPSSACAIEGGGTPACAPLPALRIVTGAPIPPGADAVVMREHTRDVSSGTCPCFTIDPQRLGAVSPGANIRRVGENARAGDIVLRAGQVISAAAVGTLAAVGRVRVPVSARVRVAVFSTGDELVDVAGTPTQWQVRDSNGPALAAFLASRPWLAPMPVGRLPDEPGLLRERIAAALAQADALLLTGGVSMGDRDFVPRVLRELGAEVVFHKVPQRPGRPVLGAVVPASSMSSSTASAAEAARPKPVLALPGNPVSVLVTARRIALPVLAAMAGIPSERLGPRAAVRLSNPDGKSLPLWWHRLVRLAGVDATGVVCAELVDLRGSGDLIAAGGSDGFVEIPPGEVGGSGVFFGWEDRF